jgi:acyl carrier protein
VQETIASYIVGLVKEKYPQQAARSPVDILATSLISDLALDSLDLIELLVTIENHYEINIPEPLLGGVDLVSDLVSLTVEATHPRTTYATHQ